MAQSSSTGGFTVRSRRRADALEVTDRVERLVSTSGISSGLCHIAVPHTTAALFINENADPDVVHDLLQTLDRLVPWEEGYRHAEGNAAAHIKAVLVGPSQVVAIDRGRLSLGRWQGIFLIDFDGPRERQVTVTSVGTTGS
jgi:secondary thiamine-phosphate synthase enzyme